MRGARTQTRTPEHAGQAWRGSAETRAQNHTHTPTPQPGVARRNRDPSPSTTPKPHTPARSGGVQAEHAHKQTHTHRTPQPGVAGYKQNRHISTHTPQHSSQEWRGATETRAQAHTPTPHTPARSGGEQAEQAHKNTHTPTPQPEVAGRNRNPKPTTTQTQTQAPRKSRKPSVHSPGTDVARAMQVTRPNETRRPGVRLHPKACAAYRLEAERATPKHLGTLVPRTCMHTLGTGYARKSSEPLGFRPKEGTCASTGAHPPGMTRSHAGGDQPSRCCPGPLCWGPPVRSSKV